MRSVRPHHRSEDDAKHEESLVVVGGEQRAPVDRLLPEASASRIRRDVLHASKMRPSRRFIQRVVLMLDIDAMNISTVNLNHLVTFDALLAERSVTRAADRGPRSASRSRR